MGCCMNPTFVIPKHPWQVEGSCRFSLVVERSEANPGSLFCTCIKKADSHLNTFLTYLPSYGSPFSLLHGSVSPLHDRPPLGFAACSSTRTRPLPVVTPSDWLRLFLIHTFTCINILAISNTCNTWRNCQICRVPKEFSRRSKANWHCEVFQ